METPSVYPILRRVVPAPPSRERVVDMLAQTIRERHREVFSSNSLRDEIVRRRHAARLAELYTASEIYESGEDVPSNYEELIGFMASVIERAEKRAGLDLPLGDDRVNRGQVRRRLRRI